MEEQKKEEKAPVTKTKRILALIGVILVIAVYIVGLVFAFMGKGYSVTVVMTCILLASYIAVYFHFGQMLVNLVKRKNKNLSEEGEQEDE